MTPHSSIQRYACALLGLSCWLIGCSDSDAVPPPTEPSELELEVRRRLDVAADAGFSGSVLVTAEGSPLVSGGYGLADREHDVANDADTAFDVGSIVKSFTAISIFKLVEDGVLAVSDPLSAFFDDVPADKADITLLELIQHRAGFDTYHDTMGDFEPMTRLEARERIFAQELLFPPGSDSEYSNAGYTLLADVIETTSGQPYTEFVRRAVFEPAKMQRSGFYSEPVWQNVDTAIGYDADTFGSNDPASWPYTWALVGNGGLVATVTDLDRWATALWSGRILSLATLEQLRTDYFEEGRAEVGDTTVYAEAGGGDFGFGGVLVDAPERGTRVIIATNTSEAFDIEEFASELTLFLLDSE
jgi:CubicO group peptidase (beta-lactamase class C family)